ncbi:MAG TPA: DUF1549 domain-containing protein [Pirellulales bacterium]|nr:DUF1549 domain-containing protein [Pirellulales bacterium]
MRISYLLMAVGLLVVAGVRALADDQATHWAFQPVKCAGIPKVEGTDQVRNPIDAFVLQTLQARGMCPAPEADGRTLIRRLSFDLIGLPPTPEELQTFLGDLRPDAYERLVDRLLDGPHYGERWGRHWLDLVRFGETRGSGILLRESSRPVTATRRPARGREAGKHLGWEDMDEYDDAPEKP